MKLTLKQLKELKDKVLYINNHGVVTACKFEKLYVYLRGHKSKETGMYAERFTCVLNCADGTKETVYHGAFPKIFYTIDDCINNSNGLHMAYIDMFEPFECIIAEEMYGKVQTSGSKIYRFPIEVIQAYTWVRNKDFQVTMKPIGNAMYDVIEDKLWDGCDTTRKVELIGYKTKEKCGEQSKIQVVTF